MLSKLQIRNYAIFDELDLSLNNGLNIITGETGAGKSILLDALSMVLGERADSSVIFNPEKKAVIEATFTHINTDFVFILLQENELDLEEEIILRREVSPNGKSRAFVNDTPVTLGVLKSLSSLLVDLHQQYDTHELQNASFQLGILDALAGNKDILNSYQQEFNQYKASFKKWDTLVKQQSEAIKERDYLSFQFEELSALQWKENEIENIELELKTLQHAEQIKQQLLFVYSALDQSETPMVQHLKMLLNKLKSQESLHQSIPQLTARMQAVQIELKDIADELEQIEQSIVFDEERIKWIEDRISQGYTLFKKHGLKTTQEILDLQENIEKKLQGFSNIEEAIEEVAKKMQGHKKAAQHLAEQLTKGRFSVVKKVEQEVKRMLTQMEMPNARLKVDIKQIDLGMLGSDAVEFLFDANLSDKFESIGKVASGGERSRLMLAIQSLVAKKLQLPTLIFDEIDTGISGEAAKQVGIIMKEMSVEHQLIVVTHQPQIAAKADHHYFVYKEKKNDRIAAAVNVLNTKERIMAIAQMMGGTKPTEASILNATEMIHQNE